MNDIHHAGLAFAYQTLYLLDATGFYSLGLHALGIHVCRATVQEQVYNSLIRLILEQPTCNCVAELSVSSYAELKNFMSR